MSPTHRGKGKGSDDGGHQLPLSSARSIIAIVRAGQPVRRKEMIITAGPEAARSFLSIGKEVKSLASIRQVDRGGENCRSAPDMARISSTELPSGLSRRSHSVV